MFEFCHKFATQYFSSLSKNKNGAVSPFSVFVCLSMAKMGAGGKTLKEFIEVLGDDQEETKSVVKKFVHWEDNEFELKLANAIFVKDGIRLIESFEQSLDESFSALVQNVALGTIDGETVVNDWIREQTKGLIDKVIKNTTGDDLAILVNAVYMKGKWVKEFTLSRKNEDFRTSAGEIVQPQMLKKECIFGFYIDKANQYKIAFFEYKFAENSSDQWEMGVLLPDQQSQCSTKIADFLTFISPENMKKFTNYSPDSRFLTKLHVLLPKVKAEAEIDLIPILEKMGMSSAFNSSGANFSEMLAVDEPVHFNEAKQRCYVDIDEQGTEAAAVTYMNMKLMCSREIEPEPPTPFHVLFPYIYFIFQPATGIILFVGIVNNPCADEKQPPQ